MNLRKYRLKQFYRLIRKARRQNKVKTVLNTARADINNTDCVDGQIEGEPEQQEQLEENSSAIFGLVSDSDDIKDLGY